MSQTPGEPASFAIPTGVAAPARPRYADADLGQRKSPWESPGGTAVEVRVPRPVLVRDRVTATARTRRPTHDEVVVSSGARPGASAGRDDAVAVVRKTALFSALDNAAADDMLRSMTRLRLRRAEVLFHEGEIGDRLYVISAGKIKLGRSSGDGRANLLSLLGPGDMFGELSLFDPGPRSATATAVTDGCLYGLGHSDLRPWLRQRPEVGLSLLSQLSRRLRRSTEVVGDLVFHDTPQRVAKVLLELAARFGVPSQGGVYVGHDLTQEELAQLVGASRETINKVLADFAGRGWLQPAARAVVLLDVERLQRRAH